jgi:hypothetical protein
VSLATEQGCAMRFGDLMDPMRFMPEGYTPWAGICNPICRGLYYGAAGDGASTIEGNDRSPDSIHSVASVGFDGPGLKRAGERMTESGSSPVKSALSDSLSDFVQNMADLSIESEGDFSPVKSCFVEDGEIEGGHSPVMSRLLESEGDSSPVKSSSLESESDPSPTKSSFEESEGVSSPFKSSFLEGDSSPSNSSPNESGSSPVKSSFLGSKNDLSPNPSLEKSGSSPVKSSFADNVSTTSSSAETDSSPSSASFKLLASQSPSGRSSPLSSPCEMSPTITGDFSLDFYYEFDIGIRFQQDNMYAF